MRLGVGLGDLSHVNELLDERLIFGDEFDLAAANQIRATVADLQNFERVAGDGGSRERRAHAAATRVFDTPAMDGIVGVAGRVADGFGERQLRRVIFRLRVPCALSLFIAPRFALLRVLFDEHLAHGLNRHSARHVARERAPHAVGDDEHHPALAHVEATQAVGRRGLVVRARPALLGRQIEHEEIVLVALPDATDISLCVQLDAHMLVLSDEY
jgi:hypothetical protein